jgi:dolichyl-phosphate beta-glucosyltransferase
VQLSLVIPAYNEEERIGATLQHVCGYLRAQHYEAEVLVVDDGSRDGTAEEVRKSIALCGDMISLLQLPHNQGKGAAVRAGLRQGSGRQRVFYDADGSTPIEELEKMAAAFAAGADIVIGSRALPDSQVEVRQAWYRQTMGRIFNLAERSLGLTRFKDTQCGFKGFTAHACGILLPRQTIERFSFDAELLFIAQRHQLKIVEVPVRWLNEPKSRVNPVIDSVDMLLDLVQIRWNASRGRYD